MKLVLEEAGIRNPVHTVDKADAAIRYLAGEGEFASRDRFPLPRVIFVDLMLPGKPGHEILRWMQTREELAPIVRAVLTGSVNPEDMKRAYDLGANCYFQKPLTVE